MKKRIAILMLALCFGTIASQKANGQVTGLSLKNFINVTGIDTSKMYLVVEYDSNGVYFNRKMKIHLLAASITASVPTPSLTLQQVTNYGATTTNPVTIRDVSSGITIQIGGNQVVMYDLAGNQVVLQKNQLVFEPLSGAISSYADGEMRLTNGGTTETDAFPGSMSIINSSGTCTASPTLFTIKNSSNNTVFASGAIGGGSNAGIYIKDASGTNTGDTIDVAATSISRRVTVQNNNRHRDTIVMKSYADSIAALIGTAHPAGTPAFTYGAAAGSPTITATVFGDDKSGFITFGTGASPLTTGIVFTLTFHTPWSNATVLWFKSEEGAGGAFSPFVTGTLYGQINRSTSVIFSVSGTALTANTNYSIFYEVIERL